MALNPDFAESMEIVQAIREDVQGICSDARTRLAYMHTILDTAGTAENPASVAAYQADMEEVRLLVDAIEGVVGVRTVQAEIEVETEPEPARTF